MWLNHRTGDASAPKDTMSNRRKPRNKRSGQQHASKSRAAVYARSTTRAAGEPVQAARPTVTGLMGYVAEPVFTADRDQPKPGDLAPSGSPGRYRASFALAVPGRAVVQEEVNFAELIKRGDSLIEVAPAVHDLQVKLLDSASVISYAARVGVNNQHRLRDIELEFDAANFADAYEVSHNIVAPLLSRWSFLHDVAITTAATQIVEVATEIHSWRLTMVGMVKGFADTEGVSDAEHRVLLSAYREGISSTEPMWQALSLYKVAEGVWAMRQARVQAARDAGLTPVEPNERVPTDVSAIGHANEHDAMKLALDPYAGKKFRAAFDDIRETLRHAVAHLDPNGSPLVQDRWQDLQKVQTVLPGLRWMARQLLDAELQAHG